MPTASTSLILDNNECFEPFTSNVYARKTLSGTFQVINKHLVRELININLWDKDSWKIIVANKGSVNTLNEELVGEDRAIVQKFLNQIPTNLKEIYKTVWEISMRSIIDMAADRSAYIDQTQSMNLFVAEPSVGKVSSMLMYAAKKKLKTLIYYLRTRTKVEADKKLAFRLSDINVVETSKPENSLFECVGCSA
jgi:ribonucleoside-diphosphate reductase alpha chain